MHAVPWRDSHEPAAADDPQCDASSPSPLPDTLDYWDLTDLLDPPYHVEAPASTLRRGCDPQYAFEKKVILAKTPYRTSMPAWTSLLE